MYYVDVYEEDRMTVAGTKEFQNKEACKHFAQLNQPCVVFTDYPLSDDGICTFRQEIARFGMEDEE